MTPYQVLTNATPFPLWSAYTPTLPAVYWDVDSQEERIKKICLTIHKLTEYADYLCGNVNADKEAIDELQSDFAEFQESGFEDYYKAQLTAYIEEHFSDLMQQILNHGVYFGLTDDGYFCANVVWQLTVYFDTIANYASDDYGRLVLNY